jgi:UDP-glucose 4-epimerase
MKILVTGGAGFIGSMLVHEEIKKGHEVIVLDDLSVTNRNVPFIKGLGADFHKVDIGKFEEIRHLFTGVDVVFHLAAMNRAQRSIENPIAANQSNINGTLHCLEAARQANVKKFVNISSSSVYAGQRDKPLTEDMPLAPPHPYGIGKLAGEHYTRVYHQLYGLPVVTLRYFSVFGPRQQGNIDRAGVVAKLIYLALTGQPLEIYGDGTQSRNFSFVTDVVRFTILASEVDAAVGHVFNIASEKEVSVNYLVQIIRQTSGCDVGTNFSPIPAGDPPRNPADVTKAKTILNYTPQFGFENGIKETVEWYKQDLNDQWEKK